MKPTICLGCSQSRCASGSAFKFMLSFSLGLCDVDWGPKNLTNQPMGPWFMDEVGKILSNLVGFHSYCEMFHPNSINFKGISIRAESKFCTISPE